MTWQAMPLAELADVRSGGGAPQSEDAFSRDGLPFVRAGSLVKLLSGTPETELERIRPEVASAHGLKPFPAGTVLFAKSGMSATKGHVYALRQEAYVVNHLAALVPRKPSDSSFLVHALLRFPPTGLIKDAAYPSIRLGDIGEMSILAPRQPKERERIAAILDLADALRRKRRKAIQQLEDLVGATFLEMFGNPVANERNWIRLPMREVVAKIDSGWSPSCDAAPAGRDEWGVLKLSAITSGRYDDSEQKRLPDDIAPRPKIEVKKGDILFARKNTHDLVAACAFVWETRPNLMMSDLIFRLDLRDRNTIHPLYLHALLMNKQKRKMVQTLANGAAGSMPNISKENLLTLSIEAPPIDRQRQFAEMVTIIEETRTRNELCLSRIEDLFSALQSRAFLGEL